MKPEISNPIEQVGQVANKPSGVELNSQQLNSLEKVPFGGIEKGSKKSDINPNAGDVNLTTVIPVPVVDDNNVAQDTTVIVFPATAADDDLIEKEWVDKAKKIVSETKDNPYKREEDVSKLQVDYLKKRYGREVGSTAK